ncbi:MAG: hypothetical protein O3A93_05570 [Chloroflexi bacterium]|nr:hypothetical protein [Chloroflexota bacterium]MDA1270711.1 hypothetical protein [Chloroflexota bacterium]PKB59568.1 MAG: hypothetical protein BZY83_01280 [SAR202 cluster bacterium Casp-Chloro-G2]
MEAELDIFQTVVAKAAGISPGGPLAAVFAGRRDIMELTERSHNASLKPNNPGGLSHSERAALACRIAKLNNEPELARHYEGLMDGENHGLADTGFDGGSDARLKAMLRHTDLVTLDPKSAVASDVSALRAVGMNDPDIVRLSQLIAFVSYQIRVVAGLRLMEEVA